MFSLYVLPVSGGGFPVQLAELCELFEAIKKNKLQFKSDIDYKPNLVLGASGGNVAGYLAMAGDWYYQGVYRVLEYLSSGVFVESWCPELNFIPTWVWTFFTGSVYRAGPGPVNILNTFFDKQLIQRTEIVTLTYDQDTFTPQLFSNMEPENSLFSAPPCIEDVILYETTPVQHACGNVETIAKICMASASVPVITQPQNIEGKNYGDGGTIAASPLSCLQGQILKLLTDKVHIYYFSPYNLDDSTDITKFTQYGNSNIKKTILRLLHSEMIKDRLSLINLLELYTKQSTKLLTFKNVNSTTLSEILETYKDNNYGIVFYPSGAPTVNMLKFDGKNIKEVMNETRLDYNIQLWYVE